MSAERLSEKSALATVPDLLYNFLAWLLCDIECPTANQQLKSTKVHLEPDERRYVSSIGQDIVFRLTHARIKPPKHVSLSMAVRHVTGSSQIVRLLSRFGHGLSLTQLNELETALAEQQVASQGEQDVFVPSTAVPGVWTTFSWDNIDFCKETLSGKGTTHCTDGITVQRKMPVVAQSPEPQPEPKRSRRRALTGFDVMEVLPYNAGQRLVEPTAVNISESAMTDRLAVHEYSAKQDFAWLLARTAPSPQEGCFFNGIQETQLVPAW